LQNGSRLQMCYGKHEVEETYHCNYGLNPQFEQQLVDTALRITGRDRAGEVRGIELATHPFFVCTLFPPERVALKDKAHPLVNAFVASTVRAPASV